MKLAIAYSTKDQVELTEQTLPRIRDIGADIFWCDGSRTEAGMNFFLDRDDHLDFARTTRVFGGADAGLAWKLSTMLAASAKYTHIGMLENDCLLNEDWFDATMSLFEIGERDGLRVGAVSARSYVDRVLIQRDGFAVCHNLGAGVVIFTREAAELVLRSFRTGFWRDNTRLFAQLSGIDIRTYAAFRGNEDNPITTDWIWDAVLARHGLASLALTPAKCKMIGQNPPLEQQGLELTKGPFYKEYDGQQPSDNKFFNLYRDNLQKIRDGVYKTELPGIIHRDGAGMLFFPHQLGYLAGGPIWLGTLELIGSQGWGPFAYRAGPGGASLSAHISGSCSFLVTGGTTGGKVAITDTRSGFNFAPELPANMDQFASIQVPGGPVPRRITCEMAEGTVFYGLQTTDPQMLDSTFKFDWSQLPKAV